MFKGFCESTIQYWQRIEENNSKATFLDCKELYQTGIQQPLEALYEDLLDYFELLDPDLNFKKNSCISSPYNDARFCGDRPMKEYMYLRFRLSKARKENVAGFYFDASAADFRYGIQIYNLNARGMEQVRGELLKDEYESELLIQRIMNDSSLQVSGDFYKRALYPDKSESLQSWLNRKSIHFSHEEPMNETFFQRTLLENMKKTFEESKSLYFLLKKALR